MSDLDVDAGGEQVRKSYKSAALRAVAVQLASFVAGFSVLRPTQPFTIMIFDPGTYLGVSALTIMTGLYFGIVYAAPLCLAIAFVIGKFRLSEERCQFVRRVAVAVAFVAGIVLNRSMHGPGF